MHPTGAGYSIMGGVWAGALLPVLHGLLRERAGLGPEGLL